MKKLLRLTLAFTLATVAAGCSSGGNNKEAGEGTATGSGEFETIGVNEYGWDVPKETLKFSFYAGYDDQAEVDKIAAPMAQFYKEKFNVELKKIVYSVDMNEKLNLMLASGDYPEVITNMSDDMAEKFIAQGRAIDLTELIDQYAPNVTEKLGKYLNMMRNDDGKIYKLPALWGENPNVAGWDFAIRYDWWKELGAPVYQTPEEFYNTVKQIAANHPTNAAGNKVYAISDNTQGANLYNAMLAAYGFKNGFKVDESTGEFKHWINTDEGLEIAKYINRFYREGLLDPDFLTNKFEDWQTKVMNERVIGNIGTWWHVWVAGQEAWAEQEQDKYNLEKRFMNVSVKAPGVEQSTEVASNFIGSYRIIITDKAKNPEQIMRWLNWELSTLGTMITGHGIPDPENIWDIKDGKWIFKDSAMQYAKKNENFHAVREKFGSQAYMMIAPGGWIKDERLDPRVTRVSVYDMWPITEDGKFLDEGVNLSWQNVKGESWDSTLYSVSYRGDDPISITNTTIKDTLLSEWAKIITSKTEESAVSTFNSAKDKLNKLGLQDLEKYNSDAYKANKEKLGE
ncbi:extracellular solute-binding protein [Cohnella sp.]|uniref:extracellular solute-binding protein n=1 Tax=Cohnella sp. TaxID=1883426 RepID=UPI00356B5EF9